jgi:hypothetical protein
VISARASIIGRRSASVWSRIESSATPRPTIVSTTLSAGSDGSNRAAHTSPLRQTRTVSAVPVATAARLMTGGAGGAGCAGARKIVDRCLHPRVDNDPRSLIRILNLR